MTGTAGMAPFLAEHLAQQGELRRIFLRQMTVQASIGIHPAELAARQRLFISVEIFLAPQADAQDDIARVLDYDILRSGIAALVDARHYNLQETLVEEIMALCLRQEGVLAARVATEKPDVYPDCEGVGYEVFRLAR